MRKNENATSSAFKTASVGKKSPWRGFSNLTDFRQVANAPVFLSTDIHNWSYCLLSFKILMNIQIKSLSKNRSDLILPSNTEDVNSPLTVMTGQWHTKWLSSPAGHAGKPSAVVYLTLAVMAQDLEKVLICCRFLLRNWDCICGFQILAFQVNVESLFALSTYTQVTH